jgi:hypothetical protein
MTSVRGSLQMYYGRHVIDSSIEMREEMLIAVTV